MKSLGPYMKHSYRSTGVIAYQSSIIGFITLNLAAVDDAATATIAIISGSPIR